MLEKIIFVYKKHWVSAYFFCLIDKNSYPEGQLFCYSLRFLLISSVTFFASPSNIMVFGA